MLTKVKGILSNKHIFINLILFLKRTAQQFHHGQSKPPFSFRRIRPYLSWLLCFYQKPTYQFQRDGHQCHFGVYQFAF